MKKTKHFIRDIMIRLIMVSGLARIYRRRKQQRGPLVRVLCLHDVRNRKWFETLLATLTAEYNVITPEQFHCRSFVADRINILLTFDDGYESWVRVCLPVMERFGVKGVFFVTSGLLDAAEEGTEAVAHFVRDRLCLTKPRRALTWEGTWQLLAAGHTIGGHTRTHARLSQLTSEAQQVEIKTDKDQLESKLNTTIIDFAYPFGRIPDFDEAALNNATAAGYTHIYSAETGFTNFSNNNFNRTLVQKRQSPQAIKSWIEGGYDMVRALISFS